MRWLARGGGGEKRERKRETDRQTEGAGYADLAIVYVKV